MDTLCRVRNKIMYVLSWRTVSALTRVLFWYLFPSLLRNSGNKHQNNPLMSAETIHHSSTCIILYISGVHSILNWVTVVPDCTRSLGRKKYFIDMMLSVWFYRKFLCKVGLSRTEKTVYFSLKSVSENKIESKNVAAIVELHVHCCANETNSSV